MDDQPYNLYLLIVFFLYIDSVNGDAELKERVLCIKGSTISIVCPHNSFIDMLPGGDIHTPVAVFIQDYFCPSNHREAGKAICRMKTNHLLSECHGEQNCNLSPSQANISLPTSSSCPSTFSTAVLFYHRCLTMQDNLNYAVMVSQTHSEARKRMFEGIEGHILSPNFPKPVTSTNQITNCSIKFNGTTNITFTMQELILRKDHELGCSEKLIFTVEGVEHKKFCGPYSETFDTFPEEPLQNIIITYVKCTKGPGGKFWLSFFAKKEAEVICSEINRQPTRRECEDSSKTESPPMESEINRQSTREYEDSFNTESPPMMSYSETTTEKPSSKDVVIGAAVGTCVCGALLIAAVTIYCLCFKGDKRKNSQEAKKGGSRTVLDRLSTRKRKQSSLHNSQSDTQHEYQINPGLDVTAPKVISETKKPDTAVNSSPHKYSYAYVDKRFMGNRVRRGVDGYDEVLEFRPNLDSPEKMTGSDTLMQENDVYSSSSSGPSSLQVGADRTSQTVMEENYELYEGDKHNNKQDDKSCKR